MSSDRRFRARLVRLSHDIQPDVERRLQQTVGSAAGQGGRLGNQIGLIVQTAAVAAIVIAVVVLTASRPSAPVGNEPSVLRGSWTTTIRPDDPVASAAGLAGTWTLAFPPTNVLDVNPPPGFSAPYSGYSFRQSGDGVRTDLFGESICSGVPPGTYHLDLTSDSLRFVVADDACGPRVRLLTSTTWTPVR